MRQRISPLFLILLSTALAAGEAVIDRAPPAALAEMKAFAAGRPGYVVWESRAPSGSANLKYRIWKRNLDGGGLAMISGAASDGDYAHVGARIAPDGRHIVFAGRRWNSTDDSRVETIWNGEYATPPFDAWMIEVDPATGRCSEARELTGLRGQVGTAGESHCFEWQDARTLLVPIVDEGVRTFDIGTEKLGAVVLAPGERELQRSPKGGIAFSASGGGAWWGPVTPGTPPGQGPGTGLGGCQVSIAADDSYLVWISKGGRSLGCINLTTGTATPAIAGITDALPEGNRYIYFPALSRDGSTLAIGGSGHQDKTLRHSHAFADYEIFLFPWRDRGPAGKPVRYSYNERAHYPGADERAGHVLDRWPDVWVGDARALTAAVPVVAKPKPAAAPAPAKIPSAHQVTAVVEAVVTRTSNAKPLLADQQYPEGLMCVEYRVMKVLSGKLAETRLITYQLARRGDQLLEPADYRAGDLIKLDLGSWKAQLQYASHKVADDIDDTDATIHFVHRSARIGK